MQDLAFHGVNSWRVHKHEQPVFDVFSPESLVYLSPDSSNVLQVGLGNSLATCQRVKKSTSCAAGCLGYELLLLTTPLPSSHDRRSIQQRYM
jgi:hypothetical protein